MSAPFAPSAFFAPLAPCAAGAALMIGLALSAPALAEPASPPAEPVAFQTKAERTGFLETSRYEETLEDCRRLERGSPWIRVTSFGKSPEGRELILVIASKDRAFDPAAAARTGKPIVLIQAGIHSGEIDGKDAGIMLLRDIAVTKQRAGLLDAAIILFMPIYNVDGHERFGLYNRINQNGPKEMGWRVTSRNLNLNRDYMKADAAETRAWLKVFTSWWPHLMVDCHVTDGADYRYDLTYFEEAGPNAPAPIAAWMRDTVDNRLVPGLEKLGHLPYPYIFLRDDTDIAKGTLLYGPTPRFSTSYTVLQNRAAFLIETHMLKDYGSRVKVTYNTLAGLLEAVRRDPAALKDAVARADQEAARPGPLALAFRPSGQTRPAPIKGIEYTRELSEVSGAMRVIYGTRPLDITIPWAHGLEPSATIERPIAYIVPPQWTEVIERLRAHGVRLRRLTAPVEAQVDLYRLNDPEWNQRPFEGRHQVTYRLEPLKAVERRFPAGSIVVRMDQRAATVAAHLLEPQGPDSLVSWGFFDAIFEQKEFAEAYVMEKVAREMMEKDPALRAEFQEALADPAFAGSPARRLDFFYRRSPWWDDQIGLYPVARLTIPWDLPDEPLP